MFYIKSNWVNVGRPPVQFCRAYFHFKKKKNLCHYPNIALPLSWMFIYYYICSQTYLQSNKKMTFVPLDNWQKVSQEPFLIKFCFSWAGMNCCTSKESTFYRHILHLRSTDRDSRFRCIPPKGVIYHRTPPLSVLSSPSDQSGFFLVFFPGIYLRFCHCCCSWHFSNYPGLTQDKDTTHLGADGIQGNKHDMTHQSSTSSPSNKRKSALHHMIAVEKRWNVYFIFASTLFVWVNIPFHLAWKSF